MKKTPVTEFPFGAKKKVRQTHIGTGQATVLEVTIIIMIYGTNFRHQKGKNKNNYLGRPTTLRAFQS